MKKNKRNIIQFPLDRYCDLDHSQHSFGQICNCCLGSNIIAVPLEDILQERRESILFKNVKEIQ